MCEQYTSRPYEVFTIDDLFSDTDINYFINYINESPHLTRKFTNSDFINGKVIDSQLSSLIYQKIYNHLPSTYIDQHNQRWYFKGVTKATMFAKIEPGKHFGIHTDTGYEYNDESNMYSKFTVLLYLNDDYKGGTTTFFDDSFIELFKVTPKKGRLLCFDIDLFHSGDKVYAGDKYWIGTELVCGKTT